MRRLIVSQASAWIFFGIGRNCGEVIGHLAAANYWKDRGINTCGRFGDQAPGDFHVPWYNSIWYVESGGRFWEMMVPDYIVETVNSKGTGYYQMIGTAVVL